MIHSRSLWLRKLCCPLWFLLTNPLPIVESKNLTFEIWISPGFVLLFLECGGETVKGVLKVSESVSTGAVVLFYQVHNAVTASHCLLLTPFRYCRYLLFLHCSLSHFINLCLCLFQFLSDSFATTFSLFSIIFFLHLINPICTRLINQMMCFFCSWLPAHPPLPFHLSLVCIQCFPHTCPVLCATPTSSRTPTHCHTHTHRPQCSAHHSCSSFCLALKKCSHKLIYHNTFSHTYTHTQNTD